MAKQTNAPPNTLNPKFSWQRHSWMWQTVAGSWEQVAGEEQKLLKLVLPLEQLQW